MMNETLLKGSYSEKDVVFLLKNLSGITLEDSTDNREMEVQAGRHYSESLPIEYQPPQEYVQLFWKSLEEYKRKVALYTGIVAEQIFDRTGEHTVLVSLARAGTPVGILIKRYIKQKYDVTLPHYSISIIRDKGIDRNAIQYILAQHPDKKIQFVDGWTGKGAISVELSKACKELEESGIMLDDTLAVLADPGYCSSLFGTREDFLIPSACLNSTVSGLVSRTVLNELYIGCDDYHGAKFYNNLLPHDVSNEYIETIAGQFPLIFDEATSFAIQEKKKLKTADFLGMEDVRKIQQEFQIENTNFIKPGVGETTRVLLRRVPEKILMRDTGSPYVQHILMLAKEKGVEVVPYPDMKYICCGIIKSLKG